MCLNFRLTDFLTIPNSRKTVVNNVLTSYNAMLVGMIREKGANTMHIQSRRLLVTIIAIAIVLPLSTTRTYATPTRCPCRHHPAEAEAEGTCSRTEEPKWCTLAFSATSEEEYTKLVNRLKQFNFQVTPRDALRVSWEVPPEKWAAWDYLAALFIISQKWEGFKKQSEEVLEAISKEVRPEALKYFGDHELMSKATKINIGRFEAIISYGCIELRRDDFYTMVKLRFSQAINYCDDF